MVLDGETMIDMVINVCMWVRVFLGMNATDHFGMRHQLQDARCHFRPEVSEDGTRTVVGVWSGTPSTLLQVNRPQLNMTEIPWEE